MARTLYPSAHILEMFMPYLHDEKRLIQVLRAVAEKDFYRNVELPSFPTKEHRDTVRRILKDEGLSAITFVAPYLNEERLSLCDPDDARREKAMDALKYHAQLAAECGYMTFGVPSGPDPGEAGRALGLELQADSVGRIADFCAGLGMKCSIEPLDRYAHKKRLLGPMDETCEWFAPVQAAHPNMYIHWDSAHEKLGGIDLFRTLDLCESFLQRIHLCNCIDDKTHPCFGDLHMEVGQPPLFETEGFLTPEVGAALLDHAVQGKTGVDTVYVSVEVLGHPGDDLWHKEYCTREFLKKCFELMKNK